MINTYVLCMDAFIIMITQNTNVSQLEVGGSTSLAKLSITHYIVGCAK